MKTFNEFMAEANSLDLLNGSILENEQLEEGFVAASVISTKLSSWKIQVARETDPQKQLEIIAKMVHIGLGAIALVTNGRK